MIQLLISALAGGWLAGGLANWAADALPFWHTLSPAQRFPNDPRTLLHYWTLPWYFLRGGVCPHCGQRRPWRAPALEIGMMAAFALCAWLAREDLLVIALLWLYTFFLLTVLVIDFEQRRVLNIMVLPAAIVVLLLSLLPPSPTPSSALLGGAIGFGSFFALAALRRGALGMGDVKLAGVIGLMTGFPGVVYALCAGIVLGAGAAIWLLATKRATRKSHMAYAPYLALGALSTIWWMLR